MTRHVDDRGENEALAALIDLARASAQGLSPANLPAGFEDVSARLAARKSRRAIARRASLAFGVMVTCAALVWGAVSTFSGGLRSRPAPALAYHIEGGTVIDGGYLHESGSAGMKLLFAEGTEFILMPGARSRLRSVDSLGARLAIERGSASFQVTPRSDARWLVDVGPFLVTVKGTVFSVFWDAAAERFELRLRHGQVSVTGPVSGGEVNLHAGQRLVVDVPRSETIINQQKPEEAWLDSIATSPAAPAAVSREAKIAGPPAPAERPATRSAGTAASVGARAASGREVDRLDGERDWPDAIAAGKWDRILAEVERQGIKATLDNASSDDLFALADAARYRRRTALAREALLAERRRFPGSVRALDAAFLLGRLEEDRENGASKALEWYDEYLARARMGTYASEALGRKMAVTNRLAGSVRARPIADEYLRRFPNGTYVGAARALQRGP